MVLDKQNRIIYSEKPDNTSFERAYIGQPKPRDMFCATDPCLGNKSTVRTTFKIHKNGRMEVLSIEPIRVTDLNSGKTLHFKTL